MRELERYEQAVQDRLQVKIDELTSLPIDYWQKYYGKSTGNVTKELAELQSQMSSMNGIVVPMDDWENHLIKARRYAIDLGMTNNQTLKQELNKVWTNKEKLVEMINSG
jgi:hypothetical protein